MVSYYTVLKFENMITGENINVGVVALDDTVVKFSILQDWARFTAMFGGHDVILDAILNDYMVNGVTPTELRKRIEKQSGMSSLYFEPLRGSLLGVDEMLDYAIKTFLVQ